MLTTYRRHCLLRTPHNKSLDASGISELLSDNLSVTRLTEPHQLNRSRASHRSKCRMIHIRTAAAIVILFVGPTNAQQIPSPAHLSCPYCRPAESVVGSVRSVFPEAC